MSEPERTVYGWSIIHAVHALAGVERAHEHAMLSSDPGLQARTWKRVENGRRLVFHLFAGRNPTDRERAALASRSDWNDQPCPSCTGKGVRRNAECPSCEGAGRIAYL